MAIQHLSYTKDWTNSSDFPTYESNETQVRADAQLLYNEIKTFLNALVDAYASATVGSTGAKEIGAGVTNLSGANVQEILTSADTAISNRYTKAETDSKFTTETHDLVSSITFNSANGVFTITKKDGTVSTIDTPIEKIPATFTLVTRDGHTYLRITNLDGTYTETDVSSLLNLYTFNNTDSIAFTATGTGSEKTITATVRAGSVTKTMLASDATTYLEGLVSEAEGYAGDAESAKDLAVSAKTAAEAAQTASEAAQAAAEQAQSGAEDAEGSASAYAGAASTSATNAGNSASSASNSASTAGTKAQDSEAWSVGQRGGTDVPSTDPTYHNNAKYWAEQASQAAGGGVTSFNGRNGTVVPLSGDYTAAMVGAYEKPSGGIPDSDIASAATWNGKQGAISANGILKGNGSGGISAAVAGTDYEVPNKSATVWHVIPASEITGASAGSIKYSRIGRFVQLSMNIMFSTAPTHNTAYATIPYGYKPSRGVVFGLPFYSDGKCYYSEINWNGDLISYDTYPAGRYCMYLITYVTDDAEV